MILFIQDNKMPTVQGNSVIKCAEIFWKLDSGEMEYRCVSCSECLYVQEDCFAHIHKCFPLDSFSDSTEAAANEKQESIHFSIDVVKVGKLQLCILQFGWKTTKINVYNFRARG